MFQLTVISALEFVRRALDELKSTEEIGLIAVHDAIDLHRLVEGFIVEAAVKAQMLAPVLALDGIVAETSTNDLREIKDGLVTIKTADGHFELQAATVARTSAEGGYEIKDGVVTISMRTPALRILSVKSSDSDVVASDMYAENSPEGRQQLNKYVRGTYDDPRLVLLKQWDGNHLPKMRYYTVSVSEVEKLNFSIEYLPYPALVEGVVEIAPRMEYAVLNYIVSLVLDAFRENEKAEVFRSKAKEYMEG